MSAKEERKTKRRFNERDDGKQTEIMEVRKVKGKKTKKKKLKKT